MKQIRLYAYSYSDSSEFCFAALLLDSYKYAIKEEPNKFTTLKLHLKVKKWHPQDVLNEVFINNCTLERDVLNHIKTGDSVSWSRIKGKDRLGADLCELMNVYSDVSFVYLFTDFNTDTTYNFTACQEDDEHEVKGKLINFL